MFQQWMTRHGLGLGPTTTPVAAGATQVCCYGCQRPGIHRKNCQTCNVADCGTSALNGFCALNVNPMVPRRSPTVSVSISGVQESAIVDTVACYSVTSAGLDKHLLATGHPTQKVIVKATLGDNDARKNGPPTPFADKQIDTGDSTPIASPPYRLTTGKRQTTQTEIYAMLEAFQTLKKQLTSTPVLRTADPTCALDAALLQGEAPEECPIEYASRLHTKTESNCSTREREVLANVWTINKFHSYVKETSIVVIIDCRPLP
jgi:hypothetical protein